MKNDTIEENEQSASSSRTVNQILTGDALTMLKMLPDGIVQTCVTSPPYFGLRDYGVEGQIGLEDSPEKYVSKLVEIFGEVKRVLRDDGTLWLNLGDSYTGGGTIGRMDSYLGGEIDGRRVTMKQVEELRESVVPKGLKPKDLMMIPARVALALQADGWYLRSDIIWHKPTAMPESVTDRPTTAHEHIFLLAKNEHYYYDADAIREENNPTSAGNRKAFRGNGVYTNNQSFDNSSAVPVTMVSGMANEWTGRNKRTVWTIPSQPYNEAHFATFPPKLIEPCILAGTSPRACEHCGSPWQRVTEATGHINKREPAHAPYSSPTKVDSTGWAPTRVGTDKWEFICNCSNDGHGHCIVLDPFMGAGTVALVTIQHGRNYLGIELNPQYVKLAEKRIAHVQQNLWSTASFDEVAV